MIKFKIICLLVLICIQISSCSNKCSVEGLEVSELLSTISKEKYQLNYCSLLKRALSGDNISIKKISLLNFDDAVGYDHGSILVDLIERIGEDTYLDSIKNINNNDKNKVKGYLDIGLMYSNKNEEEFSRKYLKDVFPKVYDFLCLK